MKNKPYALAKLIFIYFVFALTFVLLFQTSFVIQMFGSFGSLPIRILSKLSSFGLVQNPPYFLVTSFLFFVFELPFILLGFGLSYLLLRKKFYIKYHIFAAAFSLSAILLLASFSFIKPSHDTRVFSVQVSVRELVCDNLPKQHPFDWTYPDNGQTQVSIHSPVVVHLKHGVKLMNSCIMTYSNGTGPTVSSGMRMDGFGGGNFPMVPDPQNTFSPLNPPDFQKSIAELEYLRKASFDEIKNFSSVGSWKYNKTITVTCGYIRFGCGGSKSFRFTTIEQ